MERSPAVRQYDPFILDRAVALAFQDADDPLVAFWREPATVTHEGRLVRQE